MLGAPWVAVQGLIHILSRRRYGMWTQHTPARVGALTVWAHVPCQAALTSQGVRGPGVCDTAPVLFLAGALPPCLWPCVTVGRSCSCLCVSCSTPSKG